MENTFDKITEFFGCNLALAPDTDAARLPNDLADHVLRLRGRRVRVLLPFPADWPLSDVVRPNVTRHAGRGLAKTENITRRSVQCQELRGQNNAGFVKVFC